MGLDAIYVDEIKQYIGWPHTVCQKNFRRLQVECFLAGALLISQAAAVPLDLPFRVSYKGWMLLSTWISLSWGESLRGIRITLPSSLAFQLATSHWASGSPVTPLHSSNEDYLQSALPSVYYCNWGFFFFPSATFFQCVPWSVVPRRQFLRWISTFVMAEFSG